MTRRPSAQTVAVLRAFAADPMAWRYGYELGLEVGLKAGSLYTILIRLCDRGQLEASWETDAPPGRPPRHLYRLLPAGLSVVAGLDDSVERARPTERAGAPRALRPLGGRS